MDLVRELKDMTFLDWTEKKLSPGTPGCFLKAYEETEHGRVYYNSTFPAQITEHCLNKYWLGCHPVVNFTFQYFCDIG